MNQNQLTIGVSVLAPRLQRSAVDQDPGPFATRESSSYV